MVLAGVAIEHPKNADRIGGLALSLDGARAYVVDHDQDAILVVDVPARKRLAGSDLPIQLPDGPSGIAMSRDGSRVYVTGANGYVSVVDALPESATFHRRLPVPDGDSIGVGRNPMQFSFSPDGARLYVANSFSDSVSVIDTEPTSPTYHKVRGGPLGVGAEPHGLALSPDGARAYVTNTFADTVSVIDTEESSPTFHTVIATIPVGAFPAGVAVTPDGTRAYVVARDSHTVSVIDTASASAIPTRISVRETPHEIALSPDGTRAYVINRRSRDVSVLDTDPMSATFDSVVTTIRLEGQPSGIAIGPVPPRP